MGKSKSGILGKRQLAPSSTPQPVPKQAPAWQTPAKVSKCKALGHKLKHAEAHEAPASASGYKLRSDVHQQATAVVGRILQARSSQKHGASVKSLCLAPHVRQKGAVYAVVCETLRHEALLQQLLQAAGAGLDEQVRCVRAVCNAMHSHMYCSLPWAALCAATAT